MIFFYKWFDSALATSRLTCCNATSFTGLEKPANDIKDYRQNIAAMFIIEASNPQWFSRLWNYLWNGSTLGESTGMYFNTIDKAYDMLWKYKIPENITCLTCKHVNVVFNHKGAGNQTSITIECDNPTIVGYDSNFSHKPRGTSKPNFSSPKGYLPSFTSISKI